MPFQLSKELLKLYDSHLFSLLRVTGEVALLDKLSNVYIKKDIGGCKNIKSDVAMGEEYSETSLQQFNEELRQLSHEICEYGQLNFKISSLMR